MPHDEKRRAELERSWKITRDDLSRARTFLPHSTAATLACRSGLAAYEEYIYYNELELALDELEALGEQLQADQAFWSELEQAASNMQLMDRAAQLRSRSAS